MAVEVHDLGNLVECDGCGIDYTNSDAQGGIMFGTSAYCPECAPRIEANAVQYNEQQFIRGRCPERRIIRFPRAGESRQRWRQVGSRDRRRDWSRKSVE